MFHGAILFICVVLMVVANCQAQFFANDLAHEDAKKASEQDALLPAHLKNPFYQNAKIRSALAKSSWFGPGEKLVKSRDTHRIQRNDIFVALNHAGLLPQQQRF